MKRKTMTLVLCLLAALALVSVGFASWVISVDANETVSGNIKVEDVVDSRLQATITPSAPSIVFGTPEGKASQEWLTNTTIGKEVLSVKFTIVVTEGGKPYAGHTDKITATCQEGVVTYNEDGTTVKQITPVAEGTEGNYAQAVSKEYVTKMTLSNVTESTSKPGTYEVIFSVGWGAKFGGDNPYTYYNGKEAADYAEDAKTALTEMYNLLKNCGFIITIEVKH